MQAPVKRRRPARRRQEVGDRAGGLRGPGTLVARRIRASSSGFVPAFGNRVERARVPWRMSNLTRPAAAVLLAAFTLAACTGGRATSSSPSAPAPASAKPARRPSPRSRASPTRPAPRTSSCGSTRRAGSCRPSSSPRTSRSSRSMATERSCSSRTRRGRSRAGQHRPGLAAPDGEADRGAGPVPARVRARRRRARDREGRLPEPARRRRANRDFKLNADGGDKTVSVMALGMEGPARRRHGDQDVAREARRAAARLRSRRHARRATRTSRPPIARCSPTPPGRRGRPRLAVADHQAADFTLPSRPERPAPGHAGAVAGRDCRARDRRRRERGRRPACSSRARTRSCTRWSSARCSPTRRPDSAAGSPAS